MQTRWGGMREVSAKVQPWRASVQYACDQQYQGPVITGPVAMEVTFVLPRAKGHYGTGRNADKLKPSAPEHCTIGGDIDKLARGLLDPLTVRCGGNVLEDDRQIVELRLQKRYAARTESAGALVKVIPLR